MTTEKEYSLLGVFGYCFLIAIICISIFSTGYSMGKTTGRIQNFGTTRIVNSDCTINKHITNYTINEVYVTVSNNTRRIMLNNNLDVISSTKYIDNNSVIYGDTIIKTNLNNDVLSINIEPRFMCLIKTQVKGGIDNE